MPQNSAILKKVFYSGIQGHFGFDQQFTAVRRKTICICSSRINVFLTCFEIFNYQIILVLISNKRITNSWTSPCPNLRYLICQSVKAFNFIVYIRIIQKLSVIRPCMNIRTTVLQQNFLLFFFRIIQINQIILR